MIVENGHSSYEGFTMIPSCNTRFVKVKLRLKTTQLETIFNSCPDGKLFRGNYPRGNFPGGNFMGGGQVCEWGELLFRGGLFRDNCPGEKLRGLLSWE